MKCKIIHPSKHGISNEQIHPKALEIIDTLVDAGFVAYLVGGGVRDLLLDAAPKDFDIATSALPEEIKKIFSRRAILIGKRFRLAHIRFGNHIFEVSTFRGATQGLTNSLFKITNGVLLKKMHIDETSPSMAYFTIHNKAAF